MFAACPIHGLLHGLLAACLQQCLLSPNATRSHTDNAMHDESMVQAKAARDLAGGYNKVYFTLAMMSIVGIVLTFIVKRPVQAVGGGE